MKKYSYAIGVIVVYTALFWLFPSYARNSEASQKWIDGTRDIFFKVRAMSQPVPERVRDIVIVTIDEESCEKLNARWPWSRRVFASLIDRLAERGAKAIGLNVSFTGLEGENDTSTQLLADALAKHGNTVIGATFDESNHLVRPSPLVTEAVTRIGYLEKIIDPDFAIRRSYLIRPYILKNAVFAPHAETRFERSFPLQLLAAYSGAGPAHEAEYDADLGLVTVGTPHRGMFVDPDGAYTINYIAGEEDFTRIPAWKVVQGKISEADVKGKVVMVGLTSSIFADVHPTPLGMLSGIAIHANEFLSILAGRPLRFVPDRLVYAISWFAGLLVLFLFVTKRFWLGLLGAALTLFGFFLSAEVAFFRDYLAEPFSLLFGPFLAGVLGVGAYSLKLLLENKGLETKAIHDKMTGLYKYEYLRECLEEEWKRCKKSNLPVSIVMTDLDRFKRINDNLGHEVGNEMIQRAGNVIKESARRYDIVSRYGGDEFVILLWHANFEEAKAYRERLRDAYHAMATKLDVSPLLKESSISIGVATYDPKQNADYPPDPQRLVEDADKDLFTDKEKRRKPGDPPAR